ALCGGGAAGVAAAGGHWAARAGRHHRAHPQPAQAVELQRAARIAGRPEVFSARPGYRPQLRGLRQRAAAPHQRVAVAGGRRGVPTAPPRWPRSAAQFQYPHSAAAQYRYFAIAGGGERGHGQPGYFGLPPRPAPHLRAPRPHCPRKPAAPPRPAGRYRRPPRKYRPRRSCAGRAAGAAAQPPGRSGPARARPEPGAAHRAGGLTLV
nr:hypothetical protein [Tanacetum cinerariifolium]